MALAFISNCFFLYGIDCTAFLFCRSISENEASERNLKDERSLKVSKKLQVYRGRTMDDGLIFPSIMINKTLPFVD